MREVAADVVGAARRLQRQQDQAVGAVQRGPAGRQDRGDQHVARAVLLRGAGGRGRGGDELLERHPVGLTGEPLERAQHEVGRVLGHAGQGYRSVVGPTSRSGGRGIPGVGGGSRHGPARRNTRPAVRPRRPRRPHRRVLRPRARPGRPGAAGGVRHQRPPRVGPGHRVQRGAHRRDHRRDRRVPARPGHRRPAVHRPGHARAVRARRGGRRSRCSRRPGVEVHVDARDSWTPTPGGLARDPAAQRRGHAPRASGRTGPAWPTASS